MIIKEIDPLTIGLAGIVAVGMGVTRLNPNTRALMTQRDTAQQLEQAAVVGKRATEAASLIADTRRNCTPVATVDPALTYDLPTGASICDSSVSAIIGTDGKPTLIAQKVE
jgi:hypothetical protein